LAENPDKASQAIDILESDEDGRSPTESDAPGRDRLPAVLLFGTTLFATSALLFLVEPMFTKLIVPLLGSSPSVWNTAVLFFQAVLLAGYAYAHFTTKWLGVRRQAMLHVAVLLLPLLFLPLGIPHGWNPPSQGTPVLWLLGLLAVTVGPPFFVVSSAGPLLQRWFASASHARSSDPYFLYRASNLGSAVALVAYPALVEPGLRLHEQTSLWSLGYSGVVALTVGCAAFVWSSPRASTGMAVSRANDLHDRSGRPTSVDRLRWVTLSFVPVSLMLGVTSYLTADITPIPLLWVIPLVIYLLSFVLTFSPRFPKALPWVGRAFPIVALPTVLTIVLKGGRPFWLLMVLHLLTFLLAALVSHGRLAQSRPAAQFLTEFYLWIAVGGVLGGVFNALIAPVVFDSFAEYPLMIIVALMLRQPRIRSNRAEGIPQERGPSRRALLLDLVLPILLGLLVVALLDIFGSRANAEEVGAKAILVGIPALICVAFLDRPVRFALGLAAILLAAASLGAQGRTLHASRTFFGVNRVEADQRRGLHVLLNGSTVHGAQSTRPEYRDEPLAYYSRGGPLGDVFRAFARKPAGQEIAVVGLGTGAMSCYSQPGEFWTFYEIDPEVAKIARDPRLFTFLRDCIGPHALDIVFGDARLSLSRAPEHRYGLIAIDAFNSDAIPVHLLTREALALYLSKLAEDGVLAFHISNNYLDLHPVLATAAADAGLIAFARSDAPTNPPGGPGGIFASDWVVLARNTADLGMLSSDPRWHRLRAQVGFPLWTDDFSNLLRVFRWS
jgi:hypothetical protein